MPRYVYACTKCEGEFKVVHGMTEDYNLCILCEEKDTIHRIPQMTYSQNKETQSAERVKQAIEENRQILKEATKEARGKMYDG